jgi:hypothetical protein
MGCHYNLDVVILPKEFVQTMSGNIQVTFRKGKLFISFFPGDIYSTFKWQHRISFQVPPQRFQVNRYLDLKVEENIPVQS